MKKKFNLIFFLSTFFYVFSLIGNQKNCPQMFNSLWPDFCLEHLTKYPEACSEYEFDQDSGFYFRKYEAVEAYIDPEMITLLSKYVYLIPAIPDAFIDRDSYCDFIFCEKCNSPLVRNVLQEKEWDFFEEEWENFSTVRYKCKCDSVKNEFCKGCSSLSLPHCFFDISTKPSLPYLLQHLKYSHQNQKCVCYWPYKNDVASEISDCVYDILYDTLYENVEAHAFFDNLIKKERVFSGVESLDDLTSHGLITNLFSNCFFYSQYREVLLKIGLNAEDYFFDSKKITMILNDVYFIIREMQPLFLELYSDCLAKHPHPKIFYERGMIYSHQGKSFESLSDLKQVIDLAEKEKEDQLLDSELYFSEGEVYAELGLYDKAVDALTKAIQKDPNNKAAYFERANSYFELGSFDVAIKDFIQSGYKSTPLNLNDESNLAFSSGLVSGLMKGSFVGIQEFVPSVLSSIYGLGHGLWSLVLNPVEVSQELVSSCQDCVSYLAKTSSSEVISKMVPELKELINNWDQISIGKRGDLIGYVIGKYGIDIFMTVKSVKALQKFRDLRRANSLATLEAYAKSSKNAEVILAEAVKKHMYREEVLKNANLKLHWGKQGKHIINHNNYMRGKSIFEHPDPQKLIKEFAGKGMKDNSVLPGSAGYKEIVNFEEFIGYEVTKEGSKKTATTWGKIHYAKDGVHIVPIKPRS